MLQNIHKALQFIPTRVDAAINRAIERIAAKVPTVLASSTSGMYKGMLGKEPAPFTYAGEQYILWVAQEGLLRKTNVVKIAVKDRTTGQYKFVNSLKPTDFSGEAPGRMTALIAKANELVQKTKSQGAEKGTVTFIVTAFIEIAGLVNIIRRY